jgi:hypothetical protein
MQSMNLIDLDDEPAPAAPVATAAAADPFGMGPAPVAPPLDPFALAAPPPAAAAPYMSPAAADMFRPGGGPAAVAAFPAAHAAAHDPFAALAVAPTSTGVSAGGVAPSGFDEPPAFGAFPAGGPPPPAAAAAVQPAATSAGGAGKAMCLLLKYLVVGPDFEGDCRSAGLECNGSLCGSWLGQPGRRCGCLASCIQCSLQDQCKGVAQDCLCILCCEGGRAADTAGVGITGA